MKDGMNSANRYTHCFVVLKLVVIPKLEVVCNLRAMDILTLLL